MIKPVVTRVMTFALLLIAVVTLWFPSMGAGQIPQKTQGGGPVVITGDDLEIDSEQKIATYTGNVKVVQGTTSMFSNVLVIHLDQAGRQLEKAVATGNVRLVDDNITATGDEGIFYNADQRLELLNHAKVWQGNNTVTAHQIVAYLQEEVVEGYAKKGGERVIMTVYSTGNVQPSFLKKSNDESSSQEVSSSQADASKTPPPESTPAEEESASPVVIISETLRLDNPAQQATFTGNVVATKDVTKLNADKMVVYISKTAEGNDDIDKIEVFKNVRISHETTTVEGEKGLLLNKDQYAKVEGTQKKKAKAKDSAQNLTLEAPVIEIFLETNKIKASNPVTETEAGTSQPGSQRIRTVFDGESAPSFFEGAPETKQPDAAQEDGPKKEFVLTERALKTLEDDKAIPEDVMKPLKNMQDKTYSTEKEFLDALERRLGKKNAMIYREQLLDAASPWASERKKDRENDPSVTIIPQSGDEPTLSNTEAEKEAEKTETESTTEEQTSKE